MKKIVFTGGGTLGHVMPNLYLAEELKKEYECYYIGGKGIEKEKIQNLMPYHEISTIKLVRGKILRNLKIPYVLIKAITQAKAELKKIKPDVVFSKGGYVALPVCFAAKMLKIPIVAHESDYSFGLANKIILKLCNKMCVNFGNLEYKDKRIVHTGPIFSKKFESSAKAKNLNLDSNKPTILIVCGSLGSKKINDNLNVILKDLLQEFNIIHITGKGNNKIKSFDNYNSFEMVNNMVELYNTADFVVGRSGAGVTAECYYKKLPMLLIPLENKASRGDQKLNAKYYEKLGVAKIISESKLNPTLLLKAIKTFNQGMSAMQEKYKKSATNNGRNKIIEIIKSQTKQ